MIGFNEFASSYHNPGIGLQASSARYGVQSLSTLLMRDICETGIYVTFRLFAL